MDPSARIQYYGDITNHCLTRSLDQEQQDRNLKQIDNDSLKLFVAVFVVRLPRDEHVHFGSIAVFTARIENPRSHVLLHAQHGLGEAIRKEVMWSSIHVGIQAFYNL